VFRETLPALARLKTAVSEEAFAEFPAPALRAWQARFCSLSYFEERFENPEMPTWFYFVGEVANPLAMAALKVRDGIAYLGDFYVRAPAQGVGTALLEHLLDRARGQGLTRASADVFASSPQVRRWLERHGFEMTSSYEEHSLRVRVDRLEREI
jgi:GNAT superfamily N-acetyltransferase